MKTRIFYDFEATSISRDADMVSVGLVAVTEIYDSRICDGNDDKTKGYYNEIKTFYAELTDYDLGKCDNWIINNIVNKLQFDNFEYWLDDSNKNSYILKQNTLNISIELKQWLSQFEEVEFWADFDVIDKPMLIDLIGEWEIVINRDYGVDNHKIGLPKHLPNIRYDQFFDLHTLFKIKGIDTDINREIFGLGEGVFEGVPTFEHYINEFEELGITPDTHNALWDAYVSYLCYTKLMK